MKHLLVIRGEWVASLKLGSAETESDYNEI